MSLNPTGPMAFLFPTFSNPTTYSMFASQMAQFVFLPFYTRAGIETHFAHPCGSFKAALLTDYHDHGFCFKFRPAKVIKLYFIEITGSQKT